MKGAPVAYRSAIVVAGNDQTRMLLRALVRLEHTQVDGEAAGETQALEFIRDYHPALLVMDADLAEGTCDDLVNRGRALVPDLRVILIAPRNHPASPSNDPRARPNVVLLRPFRLCEFKEALGRPGSVSELTTR
jgi:DNA-binding NarL/FixJ family response regulator